MSGFTDNEFAGHPDGYPGTDEGSHLMAQSDAAKKLSELKETPGRVLSTAETGAYIAGKQHAYEAAKPFADVIETGPALKLVEIYDSVKGEGTQAGIPMTFVRFSKCNLACTWCDTPYNRVAIQMQPDELLQHLLRRKPAWVIFTGGEPCLQLKRNVTVALQEAGVRMAIETNGMVWTDALLYIDYINISPKIGEPVHKRIADELVINEMRYTLADKQKDIWNVLDGVDVSALPNWKAASAEPQGLKQLIGVATRAITISPLMDDPAAPANFKSGDGYYSENPQIDRASLNQCLMLVQRYRHHNARLSTQVHKFIGER